MRIIVIRHGESENNVRAYSTNGFQKPKSEDPLLSLKGQMQVSDLFLFDSIKYIKAQALGQYLKKKGWNIPYSRSLIHFLNF